MIRLASICGGTSTYWGILWREVDSLIWLFCLRPDYLELIEYRLKQSMPEKNPKYWLQGVIEWPQAFLVPGEERRGLQRRVPRPALAVLQALTRKLTPEDARRILEGLQGLFRYGWSGKRSFQESPETNGEKTSRAMLPSREWAPPRRTRRDGWPGCPLTLPALVSSRFSFYPCCPVFFLSSSAGPFFACGPRIHPRNVLSLPDDMTSDFRCFCRRLIDYW